MLTSKDVQLMKEWREQVVQNRTFPITLSVETDGVENPLTGNIDDGQLHDFTVMASVVERQSRIDAERRISDVGSEYIEGDLWVSIMLDQLEPIRNDLGLMDEQDEFYDRLKHIHYDGIRYIVSNTDKKGIGVRNRIETLGKREW